MANILSDSKKYLKIMIGILGGMALRLVLIFVMFAILNRGKIDQDYPLFLLYNKSNIPGRPDPLEYKLKYFQISLQLKEIKKNSLVLKSLLHGCKLLKSKCKFIVIPCNTAHYWYDDLVKTKLPIINMPKEVFTCQKV